MLSYDFIGDVHGCIDELKLLYRQLGYSLDPTQKHSEGRQLVFVGDLGDRGPQSGEVFYDVLTRCKHGSALCVEGNHDNKLRRALEGNRVTYTPQLTKTVEQVQPYRAEVLSFLQNLPYQLWLDAGKVCVAHAGLPENQHYRDDSKTKSIALYGVTTGKRDENGYIIREDWMKDYSGEPIVIYGHIVYDEVRVVNKTYGIDTGCVFGGKLSALRYPSMEIVSVPAKERYCL